MKKVKKAIAVFVMIATMLTITSASTIAPKKCVADEGDIIIHVIINGRG